MNRKLGAVIIAVAVAVGIYFMTAEKKVEQTACGKVTIAEMNWASAELMANVDKIILSTFARSSAEAQFISAIVTLPQAVCSIFFSAVIK